MKKTFGEVLLELRNTQQLSQYELANRSTLNRSYINKLENNQRNPSLKTLIKLGKALEMKTWEIIKKLEE